MAFDEHLADRVRLSLHEKNQVCLEKKMMGGLVFMINEKMCLGIIKAELMARIDPEIHAEATLKKGCRTMDFTHQPMKGFVFVSPEGVDLDEDLDYWIQLALDYNPKANKSK